MSINVHLLPAKLPVQVLPVVNLALWMKVKWVVSWRNQAVSLRIEAHPLVNFPIVFSLHVFTSHNTLHVRWLTRQLWMNWIVLEFEDDDGLFFYGLFLKAQCGGFTHFWNELDQKQCGVANQNTYARHSILLFTDHLWLFNQTNLSIYPSLKQSCCTSKYQTVPEPEKSVAKKSILNVLHYLKL